MAAKSGALGKRVFQAFLKVMDASLVPSGRNLLEYVLSMYYR